MRSTNGASWSSAYVGLNYDLNAVTFGNDLFLVAGDGPQDRDGSLFRSTDGTNWTQAGQFFGKNLRGITYANELFLLPANDGYLFATSDGSNFARIEPFGGIRYNRNLRAAAWAHGQWIVVGNDGTILTSPDLVAWTGRASRTFENQHQVTLLDGRLIVIGNRGGILQSGRFVTELAQPVFNAGAGFRLPFQGVLHQVLQLQISTNLVDWTHLLTLTNHSERGEFMDTSAPPHPLRFYRLVKP